MSTEHSSSDAKMLEARVDVLEKLCLRLSQAGAVESILGCGFERISERLEDIASQLAPLRALGPEVPQLTPDQENRKRNLLNALVSPDPNVMPAPADHRVVGVHTRSAS